MTTKELQTQTETPETVKRISAFTGINRYEMGGVTPAKMEELLNKELLIQEWSHCEITTPDGDVPGASILLTEINTGHQFSTVSFSKVILGQLARVPVESFPVMARISWLGQGNRRYLTMT